jgi:hypothetical protein
MRVASCCTLGCELEVLGGSRPIATGSEVVGELWGNLPEVRRMLSLEVLTDPAVQLRTAKRGLPTVQNLAI